MVVQASQEWFQHWYDSKPKIFARLTQKLSEKVLTSKIIRINNENKPIHFV